MRYTNINPKIHNYAYRKRILYGPYGPGILHTLLISFSSVISIPFHAVPS